VPATIGILAAVSTSVELCPVLRAAIAVYAGAEPAIPRDPLTSELTRAASNDSCKAVCEQSGRAVKLALATAR
jgi:hypothetical protein